MKFSLFKNSFTEKPSGSTTVDKFLEHIKQGEWERTIITLRKKVGNEKQFKKYKMSLPAVTVSGEFRTRDKFKTLKERLVKHSGIIAIDIDAKDNPKLRVRDLVDKDALAQYISCSGTGIKILYNCTPVKTVEEHRRIYDAVIDRLVKKAIVIKADPIVKSIASLQYVSYDPDAYYNPKTKLLIKPLPAVKIKKTAPSKEVEKDLLQLNEYIDAMGTADPTANYEDWLYLLMGIAYTLGNAGRSAVHRISCNYPEYNPNETDEKFDACLERDHASIEKPITIASVYKILGDSIPKVTLRRLAKKYNKDVATGIGEEIEQGDLVGMVRYKLFLFKKIIDKDTNTIAALIPTTINLNAFEKLLHSKGFHRYEQGFIHIIENIVEEVDLNDILRIITTHIETEGNYSFAYKGQNYEFNWEELVHLWRHIRAQGATYNQISSSLSHWVPNMLKDTAAEAYVPYRNGVVKVTSQGLGIMAYSNINQQIWKERILPREFKYVKEPGMFEQFFINVTGRGTDNKRKKSLDFLRALWYFGYMLQGIKRQSVARAWLLYDTRTGNNGRSGKTIIANAIGKVRSMVTIDGKRMDFRNRFELQGVEPWTNVVLIDDASKHFSLAPLFNMITGETVAEKKGETSFAISLKYVITSNWVLESEGTSEAGRQFVTQLDDFYVRYGKEHGDSITPIIDYHGKEFFTDWDTKDWNQFDSFCMRALQHHLRAEAPQNTIIGSSGVIRFTQLHEEELFFELCSLFCKEAKQTQEGAIVIPQAVLIHAIKDNNQGHYETSSTKAGKIAREYLKAIGGKDIEVTAIRNGDRIQMAYKLWGPLDLGGAAKTLNPPTWCFRNFRKK